MSTQLTATCRQIDTTGRSI